MIIRILYIFLILIALGLLGVSLLFLFTGELLSATTFGLFTYIYYKEVSQKITYPE